MSKHRPTTTVSVAAASTRLDSLLKKVNAQRTPVVLTQGGKPAAVLLSPTEFDDILEELDPVFQASLNQASQERESGSSLSLDEYVASRQAKRRRRT